MQMDLALVFPLGFCEINILLLFVVFNVSFWKVFGGVHVRYMNILFI
jgi:hypothetical protein